MANIVHDLVIDGVTYDLAGVHFIKGNTTGSEGVWTGTDSSISAYYDGLTIAYQVGIKGKSGGTTLNINGLGAKAVRRNATQITTTYPVNSLVHLTYVTISGIGYWQCADYDADAKTATSNKVGTKLYLVGGTSQSSSGIATNSNINVFIDENNRLNDIHGVVAHHGDTVSFQVSSGTVSKPTFTGTAGTTGNGKTGITTTGSALTTSNSTTHSMTGGQTAHTQKPSIDSTTSTSVATGTHTHGITTTIDNHSFTGTAGTTSNQNTGLSVQVDHTMTHGQSGTASVTGTAAANSSAKATGRLVTAAGTWPSHSYTAPSHSYTAPSMTSSIANQTMTITFNAGAHSFSAGTHTYSAGTAPTLGSSTDFSTAAHTHTVNCGTHSHQYDHIDAINASVTDPGHTHTFTPAGTISNHSVSNTILATLPAQMVLVPSGDHTHPFATPDHTHSYVKATGVEVVINDNGHTHGFTPAGDVSQPEFVGSSHTHTLINTHDSGSSGGGDIGGGGSESIM